MVKPDPSKGQATDPSSITPTEWLASPLEALPGIGPRRAALLADGLGLRTVRDLLLHLPRRIEPPCPVRPIASWVDGESVRCRLTVIGVSRAWLPRRRSLVQVKAEDEAGDEARLLYFSQPWVAKRFAPGDRLWAEGRVTCKQGAGLLSPRTSAEEAGGREQAEAVYPESAGIGSQNLRRWISAALESVPRGFATLPEPLLAAAEVPCLGRALHALHGPGDPDEAEAGRRRLAFGEMLRLELSRRRAKPLGATVPIPDAAVWDRIASRIPFPLSAEQQEAVAALRADCESGTPLSRLLHGEVGSGKTAVAFTLALAVAATGKQVALLAPTEILARQHLNTFRTWLLGSKLAVVGLLGGDREAERRRTLARLETGSAQIAIGTHALFGKEVRFRELGLVLFDEQHRFGVRQKAALVAKGCSPHVLTMTATPIPRTMAWARYGALDPILLRTRVGGASVTTKVVSQADFESIAASLRPDLEGGSRLFLVVPRIDGEAGLEAVAEALPSGPLAGIPFERVHGRMGGEEVARAVGRFATGKASILLGTTVVEVGLDLPAVPSMIVLGADRLGLASLHQLRGRLARGPGASEGTCWLFGEEAGLARLRILEENRDGFAVAEADLAERGPGALRGTRQHGRWDLQLFDPLRDHGLLALLREEPVSGWLSEQMG